MKKGVWHMTQWLNKWSSVAYYYYYIIINRKRVEPETWGLLKSVKSVLPRSPVKKSMQVTWHITITFNPKVKLFAYRASQFRINIITLCCWVYGCMHIFKPSVLFFHDYCCHFKHVGTRFLHVMTFGFGSRSWYILHKTLGEEVNVIGTFFYLGIG